MRIIHRLSLLLPIILFPIVTRGVIFQPPAIIYTYLAIVFVVALISLIVFIGRFFLGYFAPSDFWFALLGLAITSIILLFWCTMINGGRIGGIKRQIGTEGLTIIGQELIDYALDNDYKLPPADSWCDALLQHNDSLSTKTFIIVSDMSPPDIKCFYAFNPSLSNCDIRTIPDDTILLFRANGDWNLSGRSELLFTDANFQPDIIGVLHMNMETSICRIDRNNQLIYDRSGAQITPKW
ncbi:MAG: hypothetical protein JW936_02500 [Sedimentisphaerales bacterium]|nr:hypothetical protein [Sedimentisphaerales bacterium]